MLLQEIPEYVQRLATLAVRKRVPGRITVVLWCAYLFKTRLKRGSRYMHDSLEERRRVP